jgi:hypothetical protein
LAPEERNICSPGFQPGEKIEYETVREKALRKASYPFRTEWQKKRKEEKVKNKNDRKTGD